MKNKNKLIEYNKELRKYGSIMYEKYKEEQKKNKELEKQIESLKEELEDYRFVYEVLKESRER